MLQGGHNAVNLNVPLSFMNLPLLCFRPIIFVALFHLAYTSQPRKVD